MENRKSRSGEFLTQRPALRQAGTEGAEKQKTAKGKAWESVRLRDARGAA